jgi:hypothetical protein
MKKRVFSMIVLVAVSAVSVIVLSSQRSADAKGGAVWDCCFSSCPNPQPGIFGIEYTRILPSGASVYECVNRQGPCTTLCGP